MNKDTIKIKKAQEALQPFAEVGQWLFARDLPDDTPMTAVNGINGYRIVLTRGHFKAACAALAALSTEQQEDWRKLLRPYMQEDGSIRAPEWSDAAKLLRGAPLSAAPVQPQAEGPNDADKLAQAIHDAAVKRGIIVAGTPLSGPHLLMLCDHLAAAPVQPASKPELWVWEFDEERYFTTDPETAKVWQTRRVSPYEVVAFTRCATSSKEASGAAQEPIVNPDAETVAKWIEAGCPHVDYLSNRRIMAAHVRRLAAQPAPARDDVRNTALRDARSVCAMEMYACPGTPDGETQIHNAAVQKCIAAIRSLQSQPAPEAGKAGGQDMQALRRELGKASVGACNCTGDGPDRDGHAYACRYRALDAAMEYINRLTPALEAAPMPAQAVTWRDEFIDALILRICELPDRSSPEDDPEAMVCTPEELRISIRVTEEEFNETGRRLLGSAKTGEAG